MKKVFALLLVLPFIVNADVSFAPYESEIPISLEFRFDGFIWHRPRDLCFIKDIFNFNFNGYVKYENSYFMKVGTSLFASSCNVYDGERCYDRFFHERGGVDLQFGKYWDRMGAVRLGIFYNGPGIGGDYWVIYSNWFKWLTTLEIAGNHVHGGYQYDEKKFKPFIKWLNRFFYYDTFFISFGINHFADSHKFEAPRTQGFLGFGSTI